MTPVRPIAAARTDTGKVRDHNEDSLLERPGDSLWGIADGMGGHSRGDWASAQVVDALMAAPLTGEFESDINHVADAIHDANGQIHLEGRANGASCGSTVVAVLIGARQFGVVWVGDSRAYLMRQGRLFQLSSDHSQVQLLVDSGKLTESEARSHPMGHVLSRAVGAAPTVEVDVVVDTVAPGDVFVLCSDGLTGHLDDEAILNVLASQPIAQACEALVDLAIARGGTDNVSVILVACEAGTFFPGEAA